MSKATIDTTTADVASTPKGVLMTLSLDQIALDTVTDVRGQAAKSKDEAERIEMLAQSMFNSGQIQPILVRPNGSDGTYRIIAGRRRLAAKHVIALKAKEPQTIEAIVTDLGDEEAFAASIQENLQRKQFSPIELAENIMEIRKRFDFNGADWSKKVAEYLHVSRATITQHVKLLDLAADIRKKVHAGQLSVQSALDLMSVEESRRAETLAKAEELAEMEAIAEAVKVGKGGKGKTSEPAPVSASAKGIVEAPAKAKVTSKHIVEAARQSQALDKVKARSRGELVTFFEAIVDSTDPYPEAIVDFAKTFAQRWAAGYVGDRALFNKLDVIAELIGDKKVASKRKAS